MPSTASARQPRSLADDLRVRSDEELAELIRRRHDVVDPVPADLAELAARASSTQSVRAGLEVLPRRELEVLAVLAQLPQPAAAADMEESHTHPAELIAVVEQLWLRGLLWGSRPGSLGDRVHVVTTVRELLRQPPERPIKLTIESPAINAVLDVELIDSLGAQHAIAAITAVSQLCEHWGAHPSPVLKTGGLGVRELSATAAALQFDEPQTVFWIETAFAAGLVGPDEVEQPSYAPTHTYDSFAAAELPEQWVRLLWGWIQSDRDIHLVGQTGPEQQRLSAMGSGLEIPGWATLKRRILGILADAEPGSVISQKELSFALAELQPRLSGTARDHALAATLGDAERLGVVSRGALTSMGRSLLTDLGPASRLEVAHSILPAATDEFLAQADLTLVVPGVPTPALRGLLNLLADLESTGGAMVYRVSPKTVARVLDSGRTSEDVIAELKSRSVTPLPQPLEYLIHDVARRHGMVRIGAADSYLRTDDEQLAAALMAHPRAAALGLVQLSPGVIVSRTPANSLLQLARELGHAPVAEGPSGSVVVPSRMSHRAPDPIEASRSRKGFDELFVSALIRALRQTETTADTSSFGVATGSLPRMATAQSATVLRAAQKAGHPVWIGYADNAGSTTKRLVDVLAIDAGAISAFDHSAGRIRTLAMSRVTGVERALASELGKRSKRERRRND